MIILCNRCKNETTDFDRRKGWKHIETSEQGYGKIADYYLCPECSKKFYDFLNKKGEWQMNDKEVIQALKNLFSEHELDLPNTDSLEVLHRAVAALETKIPQKVIIKPWNPAKCPTCGIELSESLGDGYYKHPTFLEVCPNPECCQRLDWSEDDER